MASRSAPESPRPALRRPDTVVRWMLGRGSTSLGMGFEDDGLMLRLGVRRERAARCGQGMARWRGVHLHRPGKWSAARHRGDFIV